MAIEIIDKTINSKRKTAFYYLLVVCLACGKKNILKFRWGDKLDKKEACPDCKSPMLMTTWQCNTPGEAFEAAKRI